MLHTADVQMSDTLSIIKIKIQYANHSSLDFAALVSPHNRVPWIDTATN